MDIQIKMKNTIISSIILFMAVSNVPAQQKATPPPTKIILPSDTTKVAPVKKKQAKQDPQLELPDVLILGKDKTARVIDSKGDLKPDSPTLITPGSPYEPLSQWFDQEAEKPELTPKSAQVFRTSWLSLQGGGYSTVLADAGHWQNLKTGDIRFRGWFDRSSGQHTNSQYSKGGMNFKANQTLSPDLTGRIFAGVDLFSYGLYQNLNFKKAERNGHFWNVGGELEYGADKLSNGLLSFQLGSTTLETDTLQNTIKSNDFWYTFTGNYSFYTSAIKWDLGGKYLRESFDMETDSTETKNASGEISVETLFPFSRSITGIVGVTYQNVDSDSINKKSRISPNARLNFVLGKNIGLTTSLFTGYKVETFSQYLQKNPFMEHHIPFVPDETKLGLKFETTFQISPELKVIGSLSRSWMEQINYWQYNSQTGLLALNQINDVVLTEILVGGVYNLSNKTRLEASLINYTDKLTNSDFMPNFERLPYYPQYRIPVRASIELLPDFNISVEADINGERKSRINSQDTLPAYALLNISVSKTFEKRFTALFTARNLFDADYVLWENYPETGVHVLAGLRVKF